MRRTKIKICGNTHERDALRLAQLPVDAIGFIFTERDFLSKIAASLAARIVPELPPFVTSVLGMSLEGYSLNKVISMCKAIKPGALQIQYGGSKDDINTIKSRLPWIKIIKTVNVFGEEAVREIKQFFDVTDMVLIDNKGGEKSERLAFEEYLKISQKIVQLSPKPVMFGGGLNSQNVEKAIRTVQPYAVDLISGVETIPGRKDFIKVKEFIKTVWRVDQKVYG